DRVLGMFINTLPVRLRIDERGVEAALRQTHETLARLLHHEHAPLALAQRCSGVDAQAPLFTSLFNYRYTAQPDEQEGRLAQEEAPEDRIEELLSHERTNYPLTLAVDDLGADFMLTAQMAEPIDPQRMCEMMARALDALMRLLETNPQAGFDQIDVLPLSERHRLLNEWNCPAQPMSDGDLLARFEAHAAQNPARVAVSEANGVSLNYGELNAQANQLAHHLIAYGVGPDTRVALCVGRNAQLLVSLLATLKAGGAYVPLDPAYPSERLAWMLEDSAPTVIVHDGAGAQVLDGLALPEVPMLDLRHRLAWAQCSEQNPARQHAPDALAYLIYTSGSTGIPKGTAVERGGVLNLLKWYLEDGGLSAEDKVLVLSSHNFDLTQKNLLGPLLVGGSVHLAAEPFDPIAILAQIESAQISWMNLAPSAFHALIDADHEGKLSQLRRVYLGGEPIQLGKLKEIAAPRPVFVNSYGPTECSDVVLWHELDTDLKATPDSVPLGRPVRNTRIYLLDDHNQLVPQGVIGEICIGGVGVARGYLNQAELTAERFLADPFVEGGRMYKSGDLGRWLPDGTIEYLGRNDFQVKIRGFRIELGEIEAKLAQHEKISEAVVIAREQDGTKQLIAYTTGEGELEAEAIRSFAQQRLPGYMVPSAYVRLDAFPLTPNGKLDRKALPAPDEAAYVKRAYEAPQGEVEETLAQLWRELLGVEQVGRQDNFFELGGHSLMAVQLVSRIRTHFDVAVDVTDIFGAETLAELTNVVLRTGLDAYDAAQVQEAIAALDGLSEEEIQALLEAELEQD
ncbi:non-ribosomal peptide synthetase, partial [Denitromonas iodatirespirans]